MTTLETVLCLLAITQTASVAVLVWIHRRQPVSQATAERQDLMRLIVRFSDQAMAISEQNLDWMKYQQSGRDHGAPHIEHRQRPQEPDLTINMDASGQFRPGDPGPTG